MTSQKPPIHYAPVKDPVADEKRWAIFCHLSGFAGLIFPGGNIIAALIIWLYKRDEYKSVNYNGREALNFQITVAIYYCIAFISVMLFVGFILVPAVMIFHFVCMVIAAVKTSDGKQYRYPLTIRFIA